ncbi:Bifunctional solanapyrone synthase [Lachnellula suecica]|uniref:Bifunctional solanapyrone synthase n=1 Tax=Lachnellula suecica TaxID=602035 RepID=A0A8T9BZF0_9HELO|nr:Bifunctional solanapyrone synthase [Lachnellula suecica]
MRNITQAIREMQIAFPAQQLLLPGSETYAACNGSYLAQQESELHPAIIFLPKSTEDVAKIVEIVKPFAVDGSVTFAIRGAGNMPLPGCANTHQGITIDLSLLNTVELGLRGDKIVSVGAGARWAAVDEVVEAAGRGATGARSGTGGVGGLALAGKVSHSLVSILFFSSHDKFILIVHGSSHLFVFRLRCIGGLSFFSSREGFICDNVISFEIVLSSGIITTASSASNPDLWRALRGGGNNFGIVTRFDLSTFPLPTGPPKPLWGGNVYYFPPSFPRQIEALVAELKRGKHADPNTHFMISTGYAAKFGAHMCMNTVYYTHPTSSAPPVMQPFTNIEPQVQALNSLKPVTLTEAAAGQAAGVANKVRCSYMNVTVKADVETLQSAAGIYTAAVKPIQDAKGLVCSLTFQPFPFGLLQASAAKGGNALGLDPEDGPAVSLLLLTYWGAKEDDHRIAEVMKGALGSIQALAVKKGTALEYVYLNYASGFQRPFAGYGKPNQNLLQEVSKKYDPEGLFQKGVPGGFKLFV